MSICKPLVPCKELFSSAFGVNCDAGRGGFGIENLTNTIVFGVRLRSASKGAAAGTGFSGPGAAGGHRAKRDDGTGAQWY